MEFVHPDLEPNKLKPDGHHIDFLEGDNDPIDNGRKDLAEGVELITQKPDVCASGCHGTAVAGISAAEGFSDESVGIVGVAPSSRLIGYRKLLCDPPENPCIYKLPFDRDVYKGIFTGGEEATIDVYNNSWGTGTITRTRSEKRHTEIRVGAEKNDTIYVWSAGNIKQRRGHDIAANTNYNEYTASRYAIAVGASGEDGKAHHYSTPGATVLINAPSALYTTDRLNDDGYSSSTILIDYGFINHLATTCNIPSDFYLPTLSPLLNQKFTTTSDLLNAIEAEAIKLNINPEQINQHTALIRECMQKEDRNENYFPNGDYYNNFYGTSAAAPVVSGVAALMIGARRQEKPGDPLSWRDVQHILIETAHKNQGGMGETLEQEWQNNTNAAGYSHLYKYGFGRVDAGAAVAKAIEWTSVPEETATQAYSTAVFGIGDAGIFDTPDQSTLTVSENLRVEFAEVTFSSDHPKWGDLEIALTSPAAKGQELQNVSPGLVSILAEPINSPERPYDKWQFGTRRHFDESSQGAWTLHIHDKQQSGNTGKWYSWSLQLYGTELPEKPPERSYVQTVKVSAGEETLYHAGWEPLEVSEDGEAQIAFAYYAEPQEPVAGTEAQIEIRTSAAMQGMEDGEEKPSVRFAGENERELEPCEHAQDGRCWQSALNIPEAETYQLIIQGTDMIGKPVLPFADLAPNTLSQWTEELDATGDTVHRLGYDSPFRWRLVTSVTSTCQEDVEHGQDGVRCVFGESPTPETIWDTDDLPDDEHGSLSVRPASPPSPPQPGLNSLPVLLLDPADAPGTSHQGSYLLSAAGLELRITPSPDWFPACQSSETQEARCPESDPTAPGHTDPPPPSSEPTTLAWRIDAQVHQETDLCELHLFLGTGEDAIPADGSAFLTLELQPAALCADVPSSGVFQGTATCAWQPVDRVNYTWIPEEPIVEISSYRSRLFPKYRCERRTEFVHIREQCTLNPDWEQPPLPTIPPLRQPGEPGFSTPQRISQTFEDCERVDEHIQWLQCPYGPPPPLCGYVFRAYLTDGDWEPQTYARWACDTVTTTWATWTGVANCRYAPHPERLDLDGEPLEMILTP